MNNSTRARIFRDGDKIDINNCICTKSWAFSRSKLLHNSNNMCSHYDENLMDSVLFYSQPTPHASRRKCRFLAWPCCVQAFGFRSRFIGTWNYRSTIRTHSKLFLSARAFWFCSLAHWLAVVRWKPNRRCYTWWAVLCIIYLMHLDLTWPPSVIILIMQF